MSEPSPLAAGTTPPPTLTVRSPLARVHAAAGADATAVQLGSPRGGTAASSEDAGSVPPSPTLRRLHGASHGDDLCALESAVSYKPLVAPSTPRALKHQAAAAAAAKGGLVRRPATLLFGVSVVLLMVLGMAGSGVHLRLTKQEAMVGPTPRVSAASFDGEGQGRQARQPSNQEQQQSGRARAEASGGDSGGDGGSSSSSGGGGGLAALLSSAAATVASQLGVGGGARSSSASSSQQQRQQQQQQALGGTSDMPGASAAASGASTAGAGTAASLSDGDTDASAASDGAAAAAAGAAAAAAAVVSDGGDDGAAAPEWRLRCAVMNNLVFHIDVMAGWTYAFQSAGCDVTVYQNERSLGIEEIMSTWLTGRFRKPELFPGEAGDFHIVILPTFRDQHAELVQYLLQLPRLKRQRYFLTQHNPDWLLNHPNVDILQQHLLLPLLAAGRAAQERAEAAAAAAAAVDAPVAPKGGTDGGSDDGGGEDGGRKGMAKAGKGSKATAAATTTAAATKSALPPPLQPPLLRVQIATLAPCVSNYTLFFLREMAFNLTEGQTYSERVGSFRVRGGGLGAEGEERDSDKDNSAALRRWMTRVIDVDVPWLAPLVPWQPAWTSAAASSWAEGGEEAGGGGGEGGSMGDEGNGDEALAGLLLGRRRRLLKKGGGAGGGGKAGAAGAAAAAKGKAKKQQQQQQQQQLAKGKAAAASAQRPPPPPPGPVKPGAGALPPAPPPAPLGLEAIAMVRQLGLHSSGGEPRHVCIQGKLENSRRNYSAAFEALSHPAVLHQLRSSGERMLLLGHRSKWEQVVVPEAVADVVVVLASLPYSMFFDTLSRCRAILLAFATDEYYIKKSSSTIATAINVGVPLIAERRTLQAYGFLQPESCFVYDDEHAPAAPGAPAEPNVPPDDGGGTATAGGGTAVQGGDGDDGDGDEGSAHGDGAEASNIAGAGGGEAEGSNASAAGEAAAGEAAKRRLLKAGISRDERRQQQREEEEEWEEERQARGGKAQQLEEAEGTGREVGLQERQEQEQQQEEQQEEQQDAGQAGGSKPDATGGKAGTTADKDSGADASSPAAAVQDPPPGSYSAAILAALRSGSRAAIHEAVKQLKAEVMSHNTAVAAAFMAGTEGQYSAAERAQDAAQWQALLRERAATAAAGKGSGAGGKGAA